MAGMPRQCRATPPTSPDDERAHAGDARNHGGDHACLSGNEQLARPEGLRAVCGQQRHHHRYGYHRAEQGPDGLADPHGARTGAQDVPGLEVAHDVARKAARNGYHAGDEEQLDLVGLAQGGDGE